MFSSSPKMILCGFVASAMLIGNATAQLQDRQPTLRELVAAYNAAEAKYNDLKVQATVLKEQIAKAEAEISRLQAVVARSPDREAVHRLAVAMRTFYELKLASNAVAAEMETSLKLMRELKDMISRLQLLSSRG